MQKREQILATVVGSLLLVWGLYWLFEKALVGPQQARYDRIATLKKEIARKQGVVRRAREANQRLKRWAEQSLPSETEVARSRYQNWLLELVGRSGFEKPNVDSGEAISKADIYRKLPFSVRGRGTLEELVRFLFDFYGADHLHQVQRLAVSPVPNSQELDLAISIEALVLPGADRADQLSTRQSDRLAFGGVDAYRTIFERNMFGEGGASVFDPADFAFLTAILNVDGQAEAWFTVRTTGEVLKLHQGESFEVGQFRGMVSEIDEVDLVINSDEERWLLSLGENLSQATALPPEY